jgi:pimeloyl-ACP methyl ester carboxylesterase
LLQIPKSYDGTRPVPLYVWLHGRSAQLTESNFIAGAPGGVQKGTMAAGDLGQLQLEVFGRGNNAYHWAGEVDIFEAIAAVQNRFKIDPQRIVLRGFSLGGAGAWHLALHHPDRWVAAEIGAGTWPRRYLMTDTFPAYQQPTLRIWENITEWALNGFNLPIAGHDGDSDTQIASIPGPPAGTPTRGQLESSIKVREQLAKEGFPWVGEPLALSAKGTPDIFLISEKTGHGVNADVRRRLDAFLKDWVSRGQTSPDHIRFLTYTTRYNKSYWVSLDGLQKHYERAEIDAERKAGGKEYQVTTKNVTRLVLRETGRAAQVQIDGQTLNVLAAPELTLEKTDAGWRVADAGKWAGLHKTHALQGPIDDAFLDPFLLVRPTGTPWNPGVNQAALKTLERFDHAFAKNYRSHPRIKDDKDVTKDDLSKYNVILFGDPGSNKWIAELHSKLPIQWTPKSLTLAGRDYAAAEHLPAMIYPNPLNPTRYVVINSGLTISEREYNSDYSMPRLGDFAVLKLAQGDQAPEVADAGFFDEAWQVFQAR